MKKIAALLILIALSISLPQAVSAQEVANYTQGKQNYPAWLQKAMYYYGYDMAVRILQSDAMYHHFLRVKELLDTKNQPYSDITMRVEDHLVQYKVDEVGKVWFLLHDGWKLMGKFIVELDGCPIFYRYFPDRYWYIRARVKNDAIVVDVHSELY